MAWVVWSSALTDLETGSNLAALSRVDITGDRQHVTISTQHHVDLGQPQTVVLHVRLEAVHGVDSILQSLLTF